MEKIGDKWRLGVVLIFAQLGKEGIVWIGDNIYTQMEQKAIFLEGKFSVLERGQVRQSPISKT